MSRPLYEVIACRQKCRQYSNIPVDLSWFFFFLNALGAIFGRLGLVYNTRAF